MKTVLAILACLTAAAALVVPSPEQAPLLKGEGAGILVPEAPATPAQPDAWPVLLADEATEREGPKADILVEDEDVDISQRVEEAFGSCFCAGGAICCRRGGETDCGFGACGI